MNSECHCACMVWIAPRPRRWVLEEELEERLTSSGTSAALASPRSELAHAGNVERSASHVAYIVKYDISRA